MDAGYLAMTTRVRKPFGLQSLQLRQILVYPAYPTEDWAQRMNIC